MTSEQDMRRGEDAERLLNDPLLNGALKAIKDEIYGKWGGTGPADNAGREHYYRLHEAVEMFERTLRGYVQSGEAALKMMEHKKRFTLFK